MKRHQALKLLKREMQRGGKMRRREKEKSDALFGKK